MSESQHRKDDKRKALRLVLEQAEDEGLWFLPHTAPEAYLQRALRELHRAVEEEAEGE